MKSALPPRYASRSFGFARGAPPGPPSAPSTPWRRRDGLGGGRETPASRASHRTHPRPHGGDGCDGRSRECRRRDCGRGRRSAPARAPTRRFRDARIAPCRVVDVRDHREHVDDRLRRQPRHRGAPDVLDRPDQEIAQRTLHPVTLHVEARRPGRVVRNDDDRVEPHRDARNATRRRVARRRRRARARCARESASTGGTPPRPSSAVLSIAATGELDRAFGSQHTRQVAGREDGGNDGQRDAEVRGDVEAVDEGGLRGHGERGAPPRLRAARPRATRPRWTNDAASRGGGDHGECVVQVAGVLRRRDAAEHRDAERGAELAASRRSSPTLRRHDSAAPPT